MQVLVFGSTKCLGLVDRTKQSVYRPADKAYQQDMYGSHHVIDFYAVLVWTNVLEVITRVDTTLMGSRHDSGIYNDFNSYKTLDNSFSRGYWSLQTCWEWQPYRLSTLTGPRRLVRISDKLQTRHRSQLVRDEWLIGLIKDRFRIFLARWPFQYSWFPKMLTVAVHLVNLHIP